MISIVKLIEHTPFNWGIMFVWILICMAECAWVWSNSMAISVGKSGKEWQLIWQNTKNLFLTIVKPCSQ